MLEQMNLTYPPQRRTAWRFQLLLVAVTIVLAILVAGKNQLTNAASPETFTAVQAPEAVAPSCRYGMTSWSAQDLPFLEQLGIGWTLNFVVNFNTPRPPGVEYVPMVRVSQDKSNGTYLPTYTTSPAIPNGLGPQIDAHPGRLWLIGNEVDRVFVQDDVMPAMYAEIYHDVYHFIKSRDPSARVAISGLVEVTPGRLQYLDIVWDTYLQKYGKTMPVDVWNMHLYILPERRGFQVGDDPNLPYYNSSAAVAVGTDPNLAIWESDGTPTQCAQGNVYCYAEHDDMSIFIQQVKDMRQWMKDHGQQNKPLILSEFSLLYPFTDYDDEDNPTMCYLMDENGNCFTPQRVINFINNSLDYLEAAQDPDLGYPLDGNRLVQQWLWFAMNDGFEGSPNKIVTDDYLGFTRAGDAFRFRSTRNTRFANMQILETNNPTGVAIAPTFTTSVTLQAIIYNSGNTPLTSPVNVTFYADPQKTIVIGTAVVSDPVYGCTVDRYTASVTWFDLAPGAHPYWVDIEGGTAPKNEATGLVIIDPYQIALPVIPQTMTR